MQIRSVAPSDLAAVIALNDSEIPHVSRLSREVADLFLSDAAVFAVAEQGDSFVGFLVGVAPGLAYESVNYRWFLERYSSFLYVDRLVVDAGQRGSGVGRSLYEHAIAIAGRSPVACEVNLDPPNPGSLRFHQRLGFAEVGRQKTEGDTKEVSLLMREPSEGSG